MAACHEGHGLPSPPLLNPWPPSDWLNQPVEEWTYLDQQQLQPGRSRMACITCHRFRHHSGVNRIQVLSVQLHHRLLAHGQHLTHRCPSWTDDMTRTHRWAPELA